MRYLIFLLLFPITGFSQIITVDTINTDYPFIRKNMHKVEYLHDNLDTTNYIWIADLTYHYDSLAHDTITSSPYRDLGYKALELGANSFKIVKWNRLSKDSIATIKVYKLRDGKRRENIELFRENKVYFFGANIENGNNQSYVVKINGKKTTIKPNTYQEFSVSEGEELKIQFKKTKYVIKGELQSMNRYYYPASSLKMISENPNITGINYTTENLAYLLKIYDRD